MGNRLEFSVGTMDSNQKILQVIGAMQKEIRKLELENMGLRRTAGANLRKNTSVPIITAQSKGRKSDRFHTNNS